MSKNIPNKSDVKDSVISDSERAEYDSLLKEYNAQRPSHWVFSVVPGIFQQSLEETDETKFDTIKEHFGIIHSWDEIINQLHTLNDTSDEGVQYKLLFLARHGQGFHNVKHTENPELWDAYWSHLATDGKIVWGPDPELTELGIQQAKDNNAAWKREITNNSEGNEKLIVPTKFFLSPFRRSVDTMIYTWEGVTKLNAVILDSLRETCGVHVCDQRSPRRVIAEKYELLGIKIEPGFEEEDVYWKPDYRESVAEVAIRNNAALQEIFDGPDEIVSITSHSGSIRSQLMVLGHRPFAIGTGGFIPVFVKAVKVE
ncbi:hypothetical protein Cantr_00376 [Candida viswanathii]|uniref:Phosphoglycerate mutase n=1 Tax=Candida viswanathii TaxID=5486 RepID=A0A367YF69_9ASCO|nr:hypothetical protein Cantr_00376 [Candida viswanathii]